MDRVIQIDVVKKSLAGGVGGDQNLSSSSWQIKLRFNSVIVKRFIDLKN